MALVKLAEEDPTFKTYHRSARPVRPSSPAWASCIWKSSWTVFCGSSRWKPPSASLRSPTAKPFAAQSRREGRYVRQTGGHGQFGHCVDRDQRPWSPAKAIAFENKIVGGVIPKEFIAPIDAGIQRSRSGRCLWPVTKWWTSRPRVCDGSYHEVDSSEMAFKIAGSMAFKEAMAKADPVPAGAHDEGGSHHPRAVHGRRGGQYFQPPRPHRRHGSPCGRADQVITRLCRCPKCSAMPPTCAAALRAAALFTMQFDHYEEVPKSIAEKVIGKK